ncbi:hypothetical protein COU13_01465 [Candidatus Kaiserbacteria bacterium CG10_big_fil_rev_8_21_14_0_10_43_70]|uniref:Uncharacterized protein n=1 Tax=Candidatus Kaiserbacteria bacterium CG10_big_fil_rev_8_21_14_0_10_43_70 TaxID=1974605 RepID=A0A2H0UIW2_9BACT|nr:MAG: hypothetical protein COU13_01465 [Candidatus Kaiserbacteria bacterium CG10_big_fil_rev_8_21_14_0_10_43_70]
MTITRHYIKRFSVSVLRVFFSLLVWVTVTSAFLGLEKFFISPEEYEAGKVVVFFSILLGFGMALEELEKKTFSRGLYKLFKLLSQD